MKNTLQNRFSGVEGPLREALKTNTRERGQPASARRVSVRTGPRYGMAPMIRGWRVSQGYHLKGWQRPPGRSHILFLSEQPQQDVFFILGPAVDVSVLKPGGHVLL